jgi:predicted aspartyl protease
MYTTNRFPKFALGAVVVLALAISAAAFENKPLFEIPFEKGINTVVLPVKVNKTKTVRLILDTGMPEGIFLMNPDAANGMDLKYTSTKVRLGGAGPGTATASMAMGASVDMAGVPFENQRVIVMNEATSLSRVGVDGAIGASVFNKYVVQMDFERNILRLFDPKSFDPEDAGDMQALTITRTKPYIQAAVNIDGKMDRPVTMIVDTGANTSLMLYGTEKNGIAPNGKTLSGIFGVGVGGDIKGSLSRINTLVLGKHKLPNVIGQFNENSLHSNADALLGMEVMTRFLVTFDYPGKRMYLKPNRDFSKPFEFIMLGMTIRPVEGGRLKIIDVFGGSAAETAGFKKGDFLIAIDKENLTYPKYAAMRMGLKKQGRKIEIEVDREGKKIVKTIELKRLI